MYIYIYILFPPVGRIQNLFENLSKYSTGRSYPKRIRKPIHLAKNLSSVLCEPRVPSPRYNVERINAPRPAQTNTTCVLLFNIELGGGGGWPGKRKTELKFVAELRGQTFGVIALCVRVCSLRMI